MTLGCGAFRGKRRDKMVEAVVDIVVESSLIPKKVMHRHGKTTFFQLTLNPSECSSLTRASRPC